MVFENLILSKTIYFIITNIYISIVHSRKNQKNPTEEEQTARKYYGKQSVVLLRVEGSPRGGRKNEEFQ